MSSTQQLLQHNAEQFVNVLSDVDQEVAEGFDMSRAIDSTIAHVWPTRKRRIAHDLVAGNFYNMVQELLVIIQMILLLHALREAGRNWDHLYSIDKIFLPTFVLLGTFLLIYVISFAWAWFAFVTEAGNPKLLEFDELHRLLRLFYHGLPVVFYILDIVFVYAIIHCHLNNAHRSDGICKAIDIEIVTIAISLVLAAKICHRMLNFYQIFKHTQQPVRRKTYRPSLSGASIPLLSGQPPIRVPTTPGAMTSLVHRNTGATRPVTGTLAAPTLPDTATLPNTINSNYALGYD